MPMWTFLAYGVFAFILGFIVGDENAYKRFRRRFGNFHEFALYVSQHEGLKKQVNIAQIKEILSIVLKRLGL